jgi:hypothetical protein
MTPEPGHRTLLALGTARSPSCWVPSGATRLTCEANLLTHPNPVKRSFGMRSILNLGDANVLSCNVIVGYRHDHLHVRADRVVQAMDVLRGLSRAT